MKYYEFIPHFTYHYLMLFLLSSLELWDKVRTINTEVMVASAQKNLCQERMRICSLFWDAGIKVRPCYYNVQLYIETISLSLSLSL